jgi:hypothetical protein
VLRTYRFQLALNYWTVLIDACRDMPKHMRGMCLEMGRDSPIVMTLWWTK